MTVILAFADLIFAKKCQHRYAHNKFTMPFPKNSTMCFFPLSVSAFRFRLPFQFSVSCFSIHPFPPGSATECTVVDNLRDPLLLTKTRVLWNTYPVHCCCMKLCETQLIAEEDYKFARTHTFALLTMVIALYTIKHL